MEYLPLFFHLALLFAFRQFSSAVTYPRLPFPLPFDLMQCNEGKQLKATLLQLRASIRMHLSLAKPHRFRSMAVMQPREKTPDLQAGCHQGPGV